MEDLGDILFYIIAAVIAIFGAIANKKRKMAQKQVPRSNIPDQVEDTIFDSMEREITFPNSEKEERAATQYETIDQDLFQAANSGPENSGIQPSVDQVIKMGAEYEGLYSEPLAEEFASEGISVTDVSIAQSGLGTESESPVRGYSSWAKNLIEDFDLPKAIVYSEILNRKDFV
ncbi:MAG: hypothetical protein JW965_08295 [Bacteroidales bacterium]|nr:hypothetical protein [Bacteroidales bacterium]